MKIFVTGAGGFIGGALARSLAAKGHDVAGLVRAAPPVATSSVPGNSVPLQGGVRLVTGDVAALDALPRETAQALDECELLVHAAAVRRDWALSDDELRRVNVLSGPALLAAARGARRVLFVSSVAVHGHPRGGPATEESPLLPSKRYGQSKVEAEHALREAAALRGVPLTVARPGITYGPGDTYGMVANLARLVSRGRFLRVGAGRNRVNLLHVEDLARGLGLAALSPAGAGQTFLFAGPEAVTVGRLIDVMGAAVGRSAPRLAVPETLARAAAFALEHGWRWAGFRGEPFLTKAKVDLMTCEDLWDTSKASRLLGFTPAHGLEEGVASAVAWLRGAGELD